MTFCTIPMFNVAEGGAAPGSFTANVGSGNYGASAATTYTFASNTVTPTNGSGAYTYAWGISDDVGGTWTVFSGGATATAVIKVATVYPGDAATANFFCDLTDTGTGQTVRSNLAPFVFLNTTYS